VRRQAWIAARFAIAITGPTMVRVRLREVAAVRRRFGYRRQFVLMPREGVVMGHKTAGSVARSGRRYLGVGRKRALSTRMPMAIPQDPNQRWSLEFLSDAFADGRRLRILVVVNDLTTSRANAQRSSLTRRCRACGSCTSLPRSLRSASCWRPGGTISMMRGRKERPTI
jgi:hypothetical protein